MQLGRNAAGKKYRDETDPAPEYDKKDAKDYTTFWRRNPLVNMLECDFYINVVMEEVGPRRTPCLSEEEDLQDLSWGMNRKGKKRWHQEIKNKNA